MKQRLLMVVLVVVVGPVAAAKAQDKPAKPAPTAEENFRRVQSLLGAPISKIKFPKDEMPLEQYLAVLESRLPEEKNISIRIDKEGLGADFAKVANATIKCLDMRNKSVRTIMLRAMRQVSDVEIDYAIRLSGIVITRPQLTADRMVYDIREVVRELPFLSPEALRVLTNRRQNIKAGSPAKLIELLSNAVEFQSWETIDIINGSRLVVFASRARQEEVDDLLFGLRRLADLFVLMNARLYEVDRAFYATNVAPLFARDKGERPQVVSIDEALFRKISKEKVVLESEEDRLRPNRQTVFLSRQSVYRFTAAADNDGTKLMETGLAGVSFEVQPLVSADRRYLRLLITQKIADLLGIDKAKRLNIASGKEVEVESPNLRKTTLSGTATIPDAGAILMPVAYSPPGKDNAGKVWLMVARPYIWIEEEEKERRKEKKAETTLKSVWDSAVAKEEKPEPEKRLPSTDEVKEVLQAVITHVLTDPDLKDMRNEYGTEADKTLTFDNLYKLGWPKDFKPNTHGYKVVEVRRDPFTNRVEGRRVLGIRLDKCELKEGKARPSGLEGPIEICLFNAGGLANGDEAGGCSVIYDLKRVGKRWTVECLGFRAQ
jgi:hypothetical protein